MLGRRLQTGERERSRPSPSGLPLGTHLTQLSAQVGRLLGRLRAKALRNRHPTKPGQACGEEVGGHGQPLTCI